MRIDELRQIAVKTSKAGTILFIGCIALPLAFAVVLNIPVHAMFGLVSSVIVFQALAVIVGLGLQIHPGFILFIVTSVALAIILAIFEICDTFADNSERVSGWLKKMHEISQEHTGFQKYGELMLLPVIWIPGIGLYGCVLIAWLFQWRGRKAIALMLAGWLIACTFVMYASFGVVSIIIGFT